MKSLLSEWRKVGETIGFCPTMGTLHQGHMDLVRRSKADNSKTIVSIFVNPTQFNDPKDYQNYPIQTDEDLSLCEMEGVDLVYLPAPEDLYPTKTPSLLLQIPSLQANLCGKTRPGHFEGVLLVVGKLFHLVQPDRSYFGLKDYQQYRIISTFVDELYFPTKIIGIPTRREADGLAMSSRNLRLNAKERETATLLPRMFQLAKKMLDDGEKNLTTFKLILSEFLLTGQNLKIDYLEIINPIDLQLKLDLDGEFLLAVAVFVGNVRLIDNQILSSLPMESQG